MTRAANSEVIARQKSAEKPPVQPSRQVSDKEGTDAVRQVKAGPTELDDDKWLSAKLRESRQWLQQAPEDNVSIQVMMRNKSAKRQLIEYLRNEWPLDLSKTYLYEVNLENQKIYRVFYSEFDTMTRGRHHIEQLPDSVKVNSPYLDSVYSMRKALL
jgi:septal ring-binding cell division protein DamX